RRKHEPNHVRRPPPMHEVIVEDVGRIRPEIRAKEVGDIRLVELATIFDELVLCVSPGEVRVGIVEAKLRQMIHDLWTGECLRQKYRIGIPSAKLAQAPLPEGERLGMGIVDSKDSHPVIDPELEDALELTPKVLPVRRLEVEWIDVLILLRRVFCVADGGVGPLLDPLRMLFYVGMVRGCLKSDVEGDLQAELVGPSHEAIERLDAAEIRVNALVPALFRADGPRAAGIVGFGHGRVVLSLAMRASDGMDGREINDVESKVLDSRKQLGRLVERRVAWRIDERSRRPGEELVPGTEARELRIRFDLEGVRLDGARTRVIGLGQLEHVAAQGHIFLPGEERIRISIENARSFRVGVLSGAAQNGGTILQLALNFVFAVTALHPSPKLVLPRCERINPSLNVE